MRLFFSIECSFRSLSCVQVMSKLDETKSKQCKKAFVQMKTGLQTNGKRDQLSRKDFVQFMISIEQSLKQSEIQKFKEKLEEALDEVICGNSWPCTVLCEGRGS